MSFDSQRQRAEKAIKSFEKNKKVLELFRKDYQQIFDQYDELVRVYNLSYDAAKISMAELPTADAYRIGRWKRSKTPTSTVYDPRKVDPSILQIPGVVEKLNTAKVEDLIKLGEIKFEAVQGAKKEVSRTPSCGTGAGGPKTIVAGTDAGLEIPDDDNIRG
jgi:hypothetical protein